MQKALAGLRGADEVGGDPWDPAAELRLALGSIDPGAAELLEAALHDGEGLEDLTRVPELQLSSSTYFRRSLDSSQVPGALVKEMAFTL